jgi:porphyrinogen peroxidase
MATPAVAGASIPTRQPIPAPLTRAAIFLVVTIDSGSDAVAKVQSLCADFAALLRAVGFREPSEKLSCIMGFGSEAWDRLF